MEQRKLNRREAAKALGISVSQFKHGVRRGKYHVGVSIGKQEHVGQVTRFWYASDLGIAEPDTVPETKPDLGISVAPEYEDAEPTCTAQDDKTISEPSALSGKRELTDDEKFAEAYREGRATDSFGNTITGENKRSIDGSLISSLGPVDALKEKIASEEPAPGERNAGWLCNEIPVDEHGMPKDAGHDSRWSAEIEAGAIKPRIAPRSEPDQKIKSKRDRQVIGQSFWHSRRGI